MGDHDDRYLAVAQNAQFVRLLQQTGLTLAEGDLLQREEGGKYIMYDA